MNRHRAFTLIELLLASALSVILMAGVLAVIVQLRQASAADMDAGTALGSSDAPSEASVAVLAEDLRHAVSVEPMQSNDLNMITRGSLDAATYEQTHRPVRVRYHIERLGGRSWLIRRQAALDVLDTVHVQRDLVLVDVDRFELASIGDRAEQPDRGEVSPTVLPEVSSADITGGQRGGGQALHTQRSLDQWLAGLPRDRHSLAYRRYMDAWRTYEAGKKIDVGFDPPPRTKQPSPKASQRPMLRGPAPIPPLPPTPSMYWRLRLWREGQGEPSVDRYLVLR